jgi:hypothetical protein
MRVRDSSAAVLLSAGVLLQGVSADLCHKGSKFWKGNWYCQPVQRISYKGIGAAGVYNRITHMGSDGSCSSVPQPFAGAMSPLDEDVSFK